MSSRRKRRTQEAQQRAEEFLRAKVRLDGIGEDPAVAAFLTEMPTASQSKAVELALALDRYLRGDQSVLENPRYAEHISRMRARASEIEAAEQKWAADPDKFIEDTLRGSEKIVATGDRKARMEATFSKMYQGARETSKARKETQKLQLDWMIQHGPKEDVECPGVIETLVINGAPTPRLLPMRIRILHQYYDLKPGLNQGVPKVFVDHYRQVRRILDAQQAREVALQSGMRSRDLIVEQENIAKKFGQKTSREPFRDQLLAADNAR